MKKENLKLFIPPFVFNLLFWFLLGSVIFYFSNKLSRYMLELIGLLPEEGGGWLALLLSVLMLWLIRSFVIFLFLLVYKYLVSWLLSPYLSYVVKKVYQSENYQSASPDSHFFGAFWRFTVVNIRILALEVLIVLLLSSLLAVPFGVLGLPVLTFAVGSFFFGFALFDIALERIGFNRRNAEKWIWQHKIAVFMIGCFFYLGVLIPGVVVLLPFAFFHSLIQIYLLIPVFAFSIAPLYTIVATAYVVMND